MLILKSEPHSNRDRITEVLDRLRAAAHRVQTSFPTTRWRRVEAPESECLELDGAGIFRGLKLEPGSDLLLRCELDLPERVGGVILSGDLLEATLSTLYPIDLRRDGRKLFSESGVPVASGPALFTVVECLQAGRSATLEMHVHMPRHQTVNWLRLRLTTPRLRRRFEAFDVAWAQLSLAAHLAEDADEHRFLANALRQVPQELAEVEDADLEPALARMADALMPFSERIAALRVHLVGHAHVDMNWLWTWPDTVAVIKRDFNSVLALMEAYPELKFTHSQPATYEVIRQEQPESLAQVVGHIRTGRWEAATFAWVECDSNLVSGEAHSRHLLEAVQFSREVLRTEPSVCLAPDTFGHTGNLPQLLRSAGASCYYHVRANPGQDQLWPAYWWEGDDGSRILAVSSPSYAGEILARDLAGAAVRALTFGHSAGLHVHGIGDHGGGPARQNLDALRRFTALPLLPRAFCSTVAAYAQDVMDNGAPLPIHKGESRTIFEGCYTTHADAKRYNRQGENLLCTADTLAAIAGHDCRAELRRAWRAVLFNQFHDIVCGAAIHESYAQSAEDFKDVERTAGSVIDAALTAIASGAAPGAIAVTNPLGFEREDWVVVPGKRVAGATRLIGEHGHSSVGQLTADGLGFVARVPAFATVSYRMEDAAGESVPANLSAVPAFAPNDDRQNLFINETAAREPYLAIETRFFRIYLRRDCGILVSFFDKRVGRELVGFGMRRATDLLDAARADLALNVLQLVDEHPHAMSAWHYDEVHTDHTLLRNATTQVIESGPARLVLEVRHSVRGSAITQRIYFYRDLPRVDFETDVEWREVGSERSGITNLKIGFTARMAECDAWYETPFAATRRPSDGQEVPALRWADVGGSDYGFAILNDGKYGYDALGCRLRLTLLRSAYDPDPQPDLGKHRIRYSFVPHPGNWRDAGIVQAGLSFNQPLLAREVVTLAAPAPAGPAFRPRLHENSSVVFSCLKRARVGTGYILRLYETAGRSARVRLLGLPTAARVWETNVVEDRVQMCSVVDGGTALNFGPWQVRTLLVE
jgi:alpha-mannosidase